MSPADDRLSAIVAACDRALERLVDVAYPEIEHLRDAVERFRDDARRRLAAGAE